MKQITFPSGEQVPAFGMGTWNIGDDPQQRDEEIATLRLGLDLGLRVVDTAEMYGEGKSEELIGEAIAGRRDEVFLVSKVYPHNATRSGIAKACERSLRRLQTDRLDLYLLHWRGAVPFSETLAGFEDLMRAGKIRAWGVSNLDLDDMQELWSEAGGTHVQTNQLLYNLARRGIEWDLLPWQREQGIPTMAYSPLEQARILKHSGLHTLARESDLTPAQLALAWVLRHDDVLAIPKTSNSQRLKENLAAADVQLDPAVLQELDRLFPPPTGSTPLEML